MPKLLFTPVCAQGGGPLGPIHFWVLSRRNFGTKLAPHVYIPKTTIYQQKRRIKKCFVSKWRPKNKFSFRKNSHVTKIWKTTFPKEFFNKIWLKVKEHEYIYIFEIKFEKKLFCLKMAAKTSFVTLHNNAQLC